MSKIGNDFPDLIAICIILQITSHRKIEIKNTGNVNVFVFVLFQKKNNGLKDTLHGCIELVWLMTQFKNSNFLKSMKETFLKIAYLFIANPILAQFKRQSQYLYSF